MTKDLQVIVITGPTASGKTKIAIRLAKKIDAEIICADSRVLYKGFDIVSAKPTLSEQEGISHHLIDVLTPDKDFSAGDFVRLAKEKIQEITNRKKRVIICGGTWFYIKALLDKKMLPPIPSNEKLREELKEFSCEKLWKILKTLDPKRAEEINPNNKDKVIRSIEMCKALGAPVSSYERQDNDNFKSSWFCPDIEREILYKKINARTDEMIKAGLEKEFKAMIKLWGKDNKLILNTIGYNEFLQYENRLEAIEKIKQHTRNFAKRQITYFKSNSEIKILKPAELLLLRDI